MKIKHLFIDLFCGAGGTSTGIYKAMCEGEMIAEVVVCVNHDKNAILSHMANYPNALHMTEDIRTVALKPIIEAILIRKEQLEALGYKVLVHVWASLECTNFSRAKGGESRDADSRTLADHLFRYIEEINPDYIWIENVQEFMEWGPLQIKTLQSDPKKNIHYPHCPVKIVKEKKGKRKIISFDPVMVPIKERLCEFYNVWIEKVKGYGYNHQYRMLNSADFGEHTSRKRYFAQFVRLDLPMSWPSATHTKNPQRTLFGQPLPKWKAVKECLDFHLEGKSIFNRIKKWSPKTLQRLYAGLIKHVAGGKDAFIHKYNSNNEKTGINSGSDIENPCPVINTQDRLSVVKASFISKYYSGNPEGKNKSIEEPAGAITTIDHHALVQAFLTKYHGKGVGVLGVDDTCSTLTTKDRLALVNIHWLDKQYSGDENHQSIEPPSGSILSNDKHVLMAAQYFIDKQFSEGGRNQSVESPAGSITTVPKMNLVKCWIMNTNFNNVGSSLEAPAPVITANRKHHYLINPAWGGNTGDINNPCCTIVARQDKAPLYFVMVESVGAVAIAIYEDDCEDMIKIKEFMALYGIVDIKMRMLLIPELLRIQGFGDEYTLIGTQTEQKKYIGNSVTPLVVKHLIEATHEGLQQHLLKVAA